MKGNQTFPFMLDLYFSKNKINYIHKYDKIRRYGVLSEIPFPLPVELLQVFCISQYLSLNEIFIP